MSVKTTCAKDSSSKVTSVIFSSKFPNAARTRAESAGSPSLHIVGEERMRVDIAVG